ncbi:exosortase-associated EpsI family protein (plasmid) [Tundrisphaera lichenicola]|uniref:exosortase-associated EpsI family protein n=1 Tax=Tundrisphaera lichenicola TaxID=2029860 RepID=UPI003EBCD15A
MSSTEAIAPPVADDKVLSPYRRRRSTILWMSAGCVLLLISGLARAVQDRRHEVESSITETCPFPLKDIPTTLGGWKIQEGGERTLDSLTMRITGASDYVMRTYVDELTGVSLVVLVLFGPAGPVIPHTPEVCYPSSGYVLSGDSADREIKLSETETDGRPKCKFRSAIYSKGDSGLLNLREGVYYSFRLGGVWSPSFGSNRKFPRRNPGIFKIQVQRRVADGERLQPDDPIEQFLSHLIPAIEHEIDEASRADKASKTDARTSRVRTDREERFLSSARKPLGVDDFPDADSLGRAVSAPEERLNDHGYDSDHQNYHDDRR